jgi:hypothetical protein
MAGAMKGGIGSASVALPDGLVVAAMVATNGLGDVIDPSNGRIVAGARGKDGKTFADARLLALYRSLKTVAADPDLSPCVERNVKKALACMWQVVNDLNLQSITVFPDKADSPLIVDSNAVLSGSVTLQLLKPVRWWNPQRIEPAGRRENFELARRQALNTPGQPF